MQVHPGEKIGRQTDEGEKERGERERQSGYRLAQVRVARELQFGISLGSCRM